MEKSKKISLNLFKALHKTYIPVSKGSKPTTKKIKTAHEGKDSDKKASTKLPFLVHLANRGQI